jgi:hypothetical protein
LLAYKFYINKKSHDRNPKEVSGRVANRPKVSEQAPFAAICVPLAAERGLRGVSCQQQARLP